MYLKVCLKDYQIYYLIWQEDSELTTSWSFSLLLQLKKYQIPDWEQQNTIAEQPWRTCLILSFKISYARPLNSCWLQFSWNMDKIDRYTIQTLVLAIWIPVLQHLIVESHFPPNALHSLSCLLLFHEEKLEEMIVSISCNHSKEVSGQSWLC